MRFFTFVSRSFVLAAMASAAVVLAAPRGAQAQAPIINFSGGSVVGAGSNGNFGFSFTVTGTQTITGLGVFDAGSNGLINSHQVGLFTGSGALLASTTVTNANSTAVAITSPLGRYLQTGIGPVTLTAGSYVLSATYITADADFLAVQTTATGAPGFVYGGALTQPGGSLQFPTQLTPALSGGAFGPMAFTGGGTGAAAPEPGSLPLLGMGLVSGAGTILTTVRRRRKANA